MVPAAEKLNHRYLEDHMPAKKELTAKERKKLEGEKAKVDDTLSEIDEGFDYEVNETMDSLSGISVKDFKAICKKMGVDGVPVLNAVSVLKNEWAALGKAIVVREKEQKKLLAVLNKELGTEVE